MTLVTDMTNVNVEALPVVSKFIDESKGGVKVVKIIEHDGKQAVNARELHQKLGSKQEFAHWIKSRIGKYGFVENQDYSSFDNFIKRETGGSVRKEYALSIDMAKELCMVENNEQGRMIRKYFIEMERKAKMAMVDSYQIDDPLLRAERWIQEQKERKALAEANRQNQLLLEQKDSEIATYRDNERKNAPKVVFTDAVAGSQGNCLIGECAKLITQNGYKIGEKQLFAWLRENGYLGKKGEHYNIPNQQYVGKNALFYIKKGVRTGNSGVLHTTSTTMLTPKGQIYFVNKFLGKCQQGDLFA
jgi:anti-repressor protein